MKLLLLLSTIIGLNSAQASEAISAFAKGDSLYVTILTDGCNSYDVFFDTDGICRSDRMTKNYATVCSGELVVLQTTKVCSAVEEVPQAFEISLSQSYVTREAEVLNIRYYDDLITVKLDSK